MDVFSAPHGLDEPFACRLTTFLKALASPTHCLMLENCSIIAGEILEVESDRLRLHLALFVPNVGFSFDTNDCQECLVSLPHIRDRSTAICPGARVIVAGPCQNKANDDEITFHESAVIIHRPDFLPELSWTAVHAFAGSFGGWEQATKWLSQHGGTALFSRHVAVDSNEDVMHLWECQHAVKALSAPLPYSQPWISADFVGILSSIAENSILTVCQGQVNLLETMSPPCQPWSKAGKRQGLSCENGWAFISGLTHAFKLQACIVTAECADEIIHHHHFETLQHVAKLLGYRLVWSQVTPLHHISPMMRTRWLATWIRVDISAKYYDAKVNPHVLPRHRWFDPDFDFQIPPIWAEQLLLSESEKSFYGDVRFLPPAKKGALSSSSATAYQVLCARMPKESEPLPTLCASYSAQHELDSRHLQNKGAFAFLCMTPAGFAFFDPARFVSLMGATDDCILSAKIQEAFRGLGNAIAVPHALLPVLIGLLSTLPDKIDVHALLQSCWNDRLTASNAIVCQFANHVHVIRVSNVARLLSIATQHSHDTDVVAIVHVKGLDHKVLLHGSLDLSIGRLLRGAIQGPKEILYAFMLVGATQTMHLSRTAREARNIQDKWTLVIQGITCGELDFQSQKEQVWISPTLELQEPPKPPTVFVAVLQADFDTTIKALLDLGIWSAFEQLSLMWSPYQWNFVLCIPDLGISLACTADPYRRNLLCAAIQSLASVSTDFCGQPGLSDDVLVLSVTPRTIVADALAQNTLFIMTANSPCLWACKMGPSQDASTVFVVGGAIHNITQIAGQCTTPPLQPLNHGMLLHTAPCSIKAGGHHLRHGNPPTLPAHATFTQRAEFATNTHGWMAADEMAYVTQLLQWSTTAGPQYSPPVYWDITQSEFEESPFGPMAIQDHGTTYVPILAGDHWCALEVIKSTGQTHNITVVTVQVPQHLHTRIIMILARFLDIAPHRMTIIHHSSNWTPHLCGWELVYRWAGDHQVQNTLATTDTHNPMSENYRDMIDIVLQSAVEDWNEAGAQDGLAQFAFRLRRNFFLALSRRTLNSGQIANQRTLHTAYPPGYRPPIQVPHQDTPDEDQIQLRINTRLLHIQLNVSWMHSDEIDFILEGPRSLIPDTLFCPPATWISNIETLHFLAAPTPVYEPYRHILWIIETEQHWFQAECYKMQHQATLYITAPAASFEALQPLIQQLRTELGYNEANFVAHTMQQYHPAGMCGHQLVFNIYNRLGIQLPTLAVQQYGELQEGKHSAPIGYITQQAVARWHGANAPPLLGDFALHARHWFLLRVTRNKFPDTYIAAGTQTPAPMEVTTATGQTNPQPKAPQTSQVDILMQHDPWLRKGPKPTQSKWEDLLLQAPIPFVGSDGQPLKQVHRLQVSQSRAGVVLATKTHVSEILRASGSLDLAIIIPTTDGSKPAGLFQDFTGPHEITVDDPLTGTAYKRFALLHVAVGKATYQLATPKLKMTTSAITELVIEADSRLMPKQDFEKLAEQPIATFKQHLHQYAPTVASTATYYGLRTNKHPGAQKGEQQIQCVAKVPQSARKELLELSGRTFMLTRDFIDHKQVPQATSVLPKFWAATIQDLADMRIATHGVEGAAGIIATRRGLALRVWAKQIAAARTALLPTDQRITDDNRHVIPRVTIQASGWPAGTEAPQLIKSTLDATGVAVVPTRTFRAAGVHVWILTAETVPKVTRFTLDVEGTVHEILLQHVTNTTTNTKGQPKGKGKGKPTCMRADENQPSWSVQQPPLPARNKQEEERLSRLETRFDQLEQRQAGFETRVESKFDHISDSLRQILAASHQRTREVTGETPPSELQKQS